MQPAHASGLQFLGATGTVTGSRYVVESDGARVLVDCGLFQGYKVLRERNWRPFPVRAASIDAVVLTHAHLDHCGYLPRLVREGFHGPVYCTRGTRDLCGLLLPDSGRLLEEEARFAALKGYSRHARPEPLYDEDAARAALPHLRPMDFGQHFELPGGISANFIPAGHILGAAQVTLVLAGRRLHLGPMRGTWPAARFPLRPVVTIIKRGNGFQAKVRRAVFRLTKVSPVPKATINLPRSTAWS
jgi:metallo-beta-lactamase family protein